MKSTTLALIVILVLGLLVSVAGYVMRERREPTGLAGELWLKENSTLDPNSVRLAWGVRAPPEKRPNGWVFKIHLKANGSVWLRSIWYETNSVFYERYEKALNDTIIVDVEEKTSSMEWVWYLYNPSPTPVRLYVFRVSYYGVHQSFRSIGNGIIVIGVVLAAVSFFALIQRRLTSHR